MYYKIIQYHSKQINSYEISHNFVSVFLRILSNISSVVISIYYEILNIMCTNDV